MRFLLSAFLLFSLSLQGFAQTSNPSLAEKFGIVNQGVDVLRTEKAILAFIQDLDWETKMAENRDWKAGYYAALARVQFLYTPGLAPQSASSMTQELEQRLTDLSGKFDHAEIFALRAYFHLMQAKGDGSSALPEELAARIREDVVQAQSRQANNPRAMLVAAYLEFLQTKRTDGVLLTVTALRPMGEAVLQQFQLEAASANDPLMPSWGLKQAQELLQML